MSWCQVTKSLPKRDGMYLVHILVQSQDDKGETDGMPNYPVMLVTMFADGKWGVPEQWKESVSHWRHLPSPPKMNSLLKTN